MNHAQVVETVDTGYKNGWVECLCGWRKDLGDGFMGTKLASCPTCDPQVTTWNQRKVITGNTGHLKATIGSHTYFSIQGSICVQYARRVDRTVFGSMGYLESL